MGYSSNFTIIPLVGDNKPPDGFARKLESFSEYHVFTPLDNNHSWVGHFKIEQVKWVSWVEDMELLSREFPNTTIRVIREGEDGRAWDGYFLNGKSYTQQGTMVFPEFNPKLLQQHSPL